MPKFLLAAIIIIGYIGRNLQSTQVGDESLETQTVTTVRAGTVLGLVSVPVVESWIDALSVESSSQLLQIVNTHGGTNDFSNTWQEQINRLGNLGVSSNLLHVESLEVDWELGQENWLVHALQDLTLSSLSNIVIWAMWVSIRVADVVLVEVDDSLGVGHSLEWTLWNNEARVKLLDDGAEDWGRCDSFRNVDDKLLKMLEEILEADVGELGFQVSVLGQMTASMGLLGTERFLDTVNITKSRKTRLEIELRGLCKVGWLSVVVEGEKGGSSLGLSLNHSWWIDLKDVLVIVKLANKSLDLGTDSHDCGGLLTTEDEMSLIVQKSGSSLSINLVGDGLLISWSSTNDDNVIDNKLVSTWCALSLWQENNLSLDQNRGLEVERAEVGVGDKLLLGDDGLDVVGSVTEGHEDVALLEAQSVDPSEDLNSLLITVLRRLVDLERTVLVGERRAQDVGRSWLLRGDNNFLDDLGGLSSGLLGFLLDKLAGLLELGSGGWLVGGWLVSGGGFVGEEFGIWLLMGEKGGLQGLVWGGFCESMGSFGVNPAILVDVDF